MLWQKSKRNHLNHESRALVSQSTTCSSKTKTLSGREKEHDEECTHSNFPLDGGTYEIAFYLNAFQIG